MLLIQLLKVCTGIGNTFGVIEPLGNIHLIEELGTVSSRCLVHTLLTRSDLQLTGVIGRCKAERLSNRICWVDITSDSIAAQRGRAGCGVAKAL